MPLWPGYVLALTVWGRTAPTSAPQSGSTRLREKPGLRCSSLATGTGQGPHPLAIPHSVPKPRVPTGDCGAAANCKSFLRDPHCSAKFTGTNVSRNKFHRRASTITRCLGPLSASPTGGSGWLGAERTGWSRAWNASAGHVLRGQTPVLPTLLGVSSAPKSDRH